MIVDGSGNEISRERVSRNGDGIIVSGDGNRVAGNHVSDALGCPEGGCGFGISVEGGQGNLITRNLVTHGREADIRVADFEAEGGPPAVDNVVSRDLVTNAIVDGVLVQSTATGTLLERNIAVGAGDDGIDVDSAATTLTRNLSLRNADLGHRGRGGRHRRRRQQGASQR